MQFPSKKVVTVGKTVLWKLVDPDHLAWQHPLGLKIMQIPSECRGTPERYCDVRVEGMSPTEESDMEADFSQDIVAILQHRYFTFYKFLQSVNLSLLCHSRGSDWTLSLFSLTTGHDHPRAQNAKFVCFTDKENQHSELGAGLSIRSIYVAFQIIVLRDVPMAKLFVYDWTTGVLVLVSISVSAVVASRAHPCFVSRRTSSASCPSGMHSWRTIICF